MAPPCYRRRVQPGMTCAETGTRSPATPSPPACAGTATQSATPASHPCSRHSETRQPARQWESEVRNWRLNDPYPLPASHRKIVKDPDAAKDATDRGKDTPPASTL